MSLNLNNTGHHAYPATEDTLHSVSAKSFMSRSSQVLGVQHLLFGPPEPLLLPSRFHFDSADNIGGSFHALLLNLLAGFTNCPSDCLNNEIEAAFRLACEFCEIDRAALWSCSNRKEESFTLIHGYSGHAKHTVNGSFSPGAEPARALRPCQGLPLRVGSKSATGFPWLSAQVRAGKTLVLSSLGQLPAEAAPDKEMLIHMGVHSCVVIPFLAEGKAAGAGTYTCNREGVAWPDALLERLKFLTQVLGVGMVQVARREELRLARQELTGFKVALNQHAIVAMTDLSGRITYVNDKFCAISKYSREELIGQDHRLLNSGNHSKEFFRNLWSTIGEGRVWQGDVKNRAKDGSFYWESVTIVPLFNGQGRPCQYISIRADITERKLAEESLRRSYTEIRELKDRLEAESAYLLSEIRVSHPHGQIIGHSAGIKRVLHQVEQVAPAESAVLLTGETGTGKELIAQEIHRLSRRRERLMVMVNCAALPSALVESELFGRERGAYTGALTAQVGRFQVADGSTIFLDEVGELSMEVQAKLLRVLQQGEFQRLGNPKTLKVNVRVIAATNRDLAEEVRKGRFREDLYYRLNVFPIDLPPLRERIQDIPPMVFAFLEEFSTRMGKKITKVPRNAMERLQGHSWPGNIRELRNVIEHSVILTTGDVLKLSVLSDTPVRQTGPVTLAEAEREHIVKALESTNWRIKGVHGAALRLGLEPSTLYSRMQKLGIPNRRQKDEMAAGVTC